MVIPAKVIDCYESELEEIASCSRADSVCVIEVPPGADKGAVGFALARRGPLLALCYQRTTRDRFAELCQAELFSALIARWFAVPFHPAQPSRAKRLREDAKRILRLAANDVGWALTEAPQSLEHLASGARKGTRSALEELPPTVLKRFWERASRNDEEQIARLIEDLATRPKAFVDMIQHLNIATVVWPDGDLFEALGQDTGSAWELACALASHGVRAAVIWDPRRHDRSLGADGKAHTHVLTISTTAPRVLDVVARTTPFKSSGHDVQSVSEQPGHTSAHCYGSRENLLVSLAAGLATANGVQSKKDTNWLKGIEPCQLGLDDLRAQTLLLITPGPSESVRLAEQLANHITPRAGILGEAGLWKKGAQLLEHVLDPCGLVSGEGEDATQAARSSLIFLAERFWQRVGSGRPLPRACSEVLDPLPRVQPSLARKGEEAYVDLVGQLCDALRPLHWDDDECVRSWATELDEHLARHVELLRVGTVDELCELAHELGDLRALGFLQAASGSQRWVARANAIRGRADDRLAVASEVDWELRRRRPSGHVLAVGDRASLYVTHIQRAGMERADHVIVCRTLHRHMPFTGRSRIGAAADPANEERMMYRAFSCAEKSLHLLSVGDTPYFAFFGDVVDHRSLCPRAS